MARPWRTRGKRFNRTRVSFAGYLVATGRASGHEVANTAFFGASSPSTVTGTLAVTLGALTCAGTGTVRVAGTLATTLGDVTAAGTGTVRVSGSMASTLGAVTSSGAGTVRVSGSSAVTLGSLTCSGAGTVRVTGALGVTLADATLAATGSVSSSPITGTLAVTLGSLTCSGWVSLDRLDRMCVVPASNRASEVAYAGRAVSVIRQSVVRVAAVQHSPRSMSVANSPRAAVVTD